MTQTKPLIYYVAMCAVLLAFVVVMLGAYTRLGDAGLGCPDWPGCYGQVLVPETAAEQEHAAKLYPAVPVEPAKAWKEMVHRYFVGGLVVLIVALAVMVIFNKKNRARSLITILFLLALLVFQVVLGMWTVTWKLLPLVVMGHLLAGLTVLSLLWLLVLQSKSMAINSHASSLLWPWALLGLIIVFVQIALGGWVSSNYAALICPHFPFCQDTFFPVMNFKQAFNVFVPIGVNYEGGALDTTARVTIQMTHRYGAIITVVYVTLLALSLLLSGKTTKGLKRLSLLLLLVLFTQFSLGVLNVEWLLPMPVAVAHNGCAALLLLLMVTINYYLMRGRRR